MSKKLIENQSEFDDLCGEIREAGLVAFDSEFVSEHTYKPELCLLQFATPEVCVAVDPFEVKNLDEWWGLMADETTTVVVHGGQAEVRFCLELGGRVPRKLVDVQIAQGLLSCSYPLGYESLVLRVLGRKVHGRETRTDWRRRPLSENQIKYALDDANYILEIWQKQQDALEKQNRLSWAEAEYQRMIEDMVAESQRDNWSRLPGVNRLRPRELAVARELTNWRVSVADRRNRPLRRILRDDLIVEIARRRPRTTQDVLATRDMNRQDYKRIIPELLECVERALALDESDLPDPLKNDKKQKKSDEHVLGQLLGIALTNRCVEMNVAKQLVGTSADLRHLVRWHVEGNREGETPRLSRGWQAEVCGNLLTDILDGKISLRVGDPDSDHPLVFEKTD